VPEFKKVIGIVDQAPKTPSGPLAPEDNPFFKPKRSADATENVSMCGVWSLQNACGACSASARSWASTTKLEILAGQSALTAVHTYTIFCFIMVVLVRGVRPRRRRVAKLEHGQRA